MTTEERAAHLTAIEAAVGTGNLALYGRAATGMGRYGMDENTGRGTAAQELCV